MFLLDCFERDMIKNVLIIKKAVGYESSKLWIRIILALGANHLNFGYESTGYETSVATKRPDSISRTSCKQVYANFCWHWAHCDKELHDDPNKSFAVCYWLLIKSCCLSNRLLAKSTFATKIFTICFFFVEETFNWVLRNKIDQVSPMFISEHQCK